MDAPEFHFYQEIKKDKYYEPLIPPKETGLVIILLYEQWKTGLFTANNFSENAVKEAIEQVATDFGKSYERKPHEHFKDINLRLQEYFLFRNEDSDYYKLTQYAIDFCERIKEKLLSEFNPSEIEKILANLISDLKGYIKQDDFPYWFKHHFTPNKAHLKNQIEALLHRVMNSVRAFRSISKKDDAKFLDTVRKIDLNLQEIKKQASQLQDAFGDVDELNRILTDLSVSDHDGKYGEGINDVRLFIGEIRTDLSNIGYKIERIRPGLRRFINSINQRNFDRNTEYFLQYLLVESKLKRTSSGFSIVLPTDIGQKKLRESVPKFIIIEGERLLPTQPRAIIEVPKDETKRKKQTQQARIQLELRNKVANRLIELGNILEEQGKVNYAEFYFNILGQEKEFSNEIAIYTTYSALRKFGKHPLYTIKINPKLDQYVDHPNMAIWNMTISKNQKIK